MTQSPITTTTPDALSAAIAEAVQVDALQLQAAIGSIVIASSEEAQVSDPQIQSIYDGTSRTLTLLVDRIPAGQEELAFAAALDQHLGHESAVDLVGEEGTALALQKQARVDQTFPYMLLGRLKQDCEYYLDHGNRAKKHLWAGDETEQIAKMRELYAGMREKPQWISLDDIARYEAEMCGVVEHAATKPDNQLHYLKVAHPLGDRWLCSVSSLLTTADPKSALGMPPDKASALHKQLTSIGYKGLTIVDRLPEAMHGIWSLREALTKAITVDGHSLDSVIGRLTVSTSTGYPHVAAEARSTNDEGVTVLFADRIPIGQEAHIFAIEIDRWHGREAARSILGDYVDGALSQEATAIAQLEPLAVDQRPKVPQTLDSGASHASTNPVDVLLSNLHSRMQNAERQLNSGREKKFPREQILLMEGAWAEANNSYHAAQQLVGRSIEDPSKQANESPSPGM